MHATGNGLLDKGRGAAFGAWHLLERGELTC